MYSKEIPTSKVLSIKVGKFLTLEESLIGQQFEENFKWLSKNYDNLRKDYLSQYVAVRDKSIVGYNVDHNNLLSKLRKEYGERIDPTAIDYISPKEDELQKDIDRFCK